MNEEIKQHITKFNQSKGWGTTEQDLINTITDSKAIWEGDEDEHRWWTNFLKVIDINGMYIGFWWAKTTGDDSPEDKGWEFDPSTICRVVAKEVKTIVYEPVKE